MSQRDNILTSESNYGKADALQLSETQAFSNQGIVENKNLNSIEPVLKAGEPIFDRNQPQMSGGQYISKNNPDLNSDLSTNIGMSSNRDLSTIDRPNLSSVTSTNNGLQMNTGPLLSNKPAMNNGPPTFSLSPSTNVQSGPISNNMPPLNSGSTNMSSPAPVSTSFLSNISPMNTGSSSLSRSSMNIHNAPHVSVNNLTLVSSNQPSMNRSPINMQSRPLISSLHSSDPSMNNRSSINASNRPPVSIPHSSNMISMNSGSTLNNRSAINAQTGPFGSNPLSNNAPSISSGQSLSTPPMNTQVGQTMSNTLSSNIPPIGTTSNNRPHVSTPIGLPVSSMIPSGMPPVSSGLPLTAGSPMATSTFVVNRTQTSTQSGQQVSNSSQNYIPVSQSESPTSSGSLFNNGPLISGPPMTSGFSMQSGSQLSSGILKNTNSSLQSGPLNRPTISGESTISGPPVSSGAPSYTGAPVISGLPSYTGAPVSSGAPSYTGAPVSSGAPSYTGAPVNSGPPSYSGPSVSSGPPYTGLPMNRGSLMNINQTTNSGQSMNRPAPHHGLQYNAGPSSTRSDTTQILTQQLQNVNLSGPVSSNQYNYKPESPATNRAPDMRSPNYTNSSPYTNQINYQNTNVAKSGFNKIWGMEYVDLLQSRNVLPPEKVVPPRINLHQELLDRVNCSPDIFRCTLTKIPDSNALLQKARLPLGILIHPFKDLNHLPVIQCSTIVRCRSCRTYINPFVYFVDSKRWKCNLCYKVNELPEEFQFDPATKSYGDPSRRPEIRTSTIEFIAPSEYMLRPPQPAVYLFIFDVSKLAVDSGYLSTVCNIVAEEMSRLPGDSRTQAGFLAVNSAIHFFSMQENASQPHQMIMLDIDDVFLPCPENLIVNLKEREELIKDLLTQLPCIFKDSYDTNCALGAALQVAFKLISPTGGRVTVFQCCLPNLGPGALQAREDPNTRAAKDVPHLNPATDFYKRLALDCSGQQVAVDLFLLNGQYSDLATLSGICKFSGGCIYYLPLFQSTKSQHVEALEKMLRRYLTRKIGFEAVMRIRCTRGLSIHTFHGNFFVRSTDLLSLPNINPDAGFGMQVIIEENLSDMQTICFQAALLYTSSKGERRIRVHTLCLPITSSLSDVIYSADQQCIIGLLAKMAVDRSLQRSLSDAREALINAAVDTLSAYKVLQGCSVGGLLAPHNLKLMPMYIMALLKSRAFRFGISTRLDDRVFAMCQLKTLPLSQLIQLIYPDLYPVHEYVQKTIQEIDGQLVPQPERLHLSAEKLDSRGAFLLDAGDQMYLYVGKNIHPTFCYNVLGVQSFASIPEEMYGLPDLSTPESETLRTLIASLLDEKPYYATLQIIRDDGHFRNQFTERLIEDRLENALSYYEFLQHIKNQVK